MDKAQHRKEWNEKARICLEGNLDNKHNWIPIEKLKTKSGEIVTALMCGYCFHKIYIEHCHTLLDCKSRDD